LKARASYPESAETQTLLVEVPEERNADALVWLYKSIASEAIRRHQRAARHGSYFAGELQSIANETDCHRKLEVVTLVPPRRRHSPTKYE
jgi:hypothetical protein